MSHPIYHLDLRVDGCLAAVRPNGFLLAAGARIMTAPPVNQLLVGAGNRVEVDLAPLLDDDGDDDLDLDMGSDDDLDLH